MRGEKKTVKERAADYVSVVEETMKSEYWLGMKDELEEAGFTCGDLIEPPISESITVDTDAPESTKMELSNRVCLQLANKFDHAKDINILIRRQMAGAFRKSIRSDKEIQAARMRERVPGG